MPFSNGLFEALEEQLAEARDFALDTPAISDQTYSHENLLLCIATLRQAQLTVEELKSHVGGLESAEEPNDSGVHAMAAKTGDVADAPENDISGMARALQTKARPQ